MVINFTRFLITARIIRSDPKVEKKKSWHIFMENPYTQCRHPEELRFIIDMVEAFIS